MQRFRPLLLAATVGLTAALSSCSSTRYFDFTTASSRQSSYHASTLRQASAPATARSEAAPVVTPGDASAIAEPTASASAASVSAAPAVVPAVPTVVAQPLAPAAVSLSEQLRSARAERRLTRAQERRYERVLNRVQRAEQQQPSSASKDDNTLVQVILCLLPPLTLLGVYLHEGAINSKFWITLLLLILFVLPGVIYGLLVVTDTI